LKVEFTEGIDPDPLILAILLNLPTFIRHIHIQSRARCKQLCHKSV